MKSLFQVQSVLRTPLGIGGVIHAEGTTGIQLGLIFWLAGCLAGWAGGWLAASI